jgi:signal transduction histidine kinase
VLPRVTDDVSALVNRILVGYTVLVVIPALGSVVAQVPRTAWWWTLTCGAGIVLSSGGQVVAAVGRRSLRGPTVGLAASLLVGMVTGPAAFPAGTAEPWLWWLVGPAGVAVALVFGIRVSAGYLVLLCGAHAWWRTLPAGGDLDPLTAASVGLYATVAALVIGATGRGMVVAARAADDLSTAVYRRELSEAVDRAVAEERSRLDRLIHDDVMTTMIAAAHAEDRDGVEDTAALARETLHKIDRLPAEDDPLGTVAAEAFARLLHDTARRVSPSVEVTVDVPPALARHPVPVATAEAFLSAMREAVRNAGRHSGSADLRVGCALTRRPGAPGVELRVTVVDEGQGFDPGAVGAERLGIDLSIVRAVRAVGADAVVESAPGTGTRVSLVGSVPDGTTVRATPRPTAGEPLLPAEFPAASLVRLMWVATAVEILRWLIDPDGTDPVWPHAVAVPLLVLLCYLVFQRGARLVLPRAEAAGAVVLTVAICALTTPTLPLDRWSDSGTWHIFVLQLVLIGLVIRRRVLAGLLSLAALGAAMTWWSLRSALGWWGVLQAMFGPVTFLGMALAVSRTLAVLARREVHLQAQETAAVDESARRHVALVQRSLWLADLRHTARAVLVRVAAGESTADLRSEALLVEASLRESLIARNVMSEELASMTAAARRRGVRVTFVDSRRTPLPDAVGKAVVAEVRGALRSPTVSRLVVRLGPDGRRQLASVVSEDEGDLSMIMIDADGARAGDDRG